MTWALFLSDYEAKLEATEAALDNDTPLPEDVLGPFVPPTDLGAMPASLEGDALRILARNAELELRLRKSVETLGRELGQATRVSDGISRFGTFGDSTTPTYLDRSV